MLTVDSLNVAMPLTTVLDANNVILVPVAGSPLDALVVATRSDTKFNNKSTDGGFEPDLYNIEYIANAKDPVLNVSKHDAVMDNLIEVIGASVKEHIIFAKNVVAPAIEDLVTSVQTTLNGLTPSSLLGMEVIVWNPPKPMLSSSLENAVRKFEELPYDVPTMNMKLPEITVSEMIELMRSGAGNMDDDISEWAAVKGESFFIKVWNDIFQQKQVSLEDTRVITFKDYVYHPVEGWDFALAIYLLSRKLADKPLPETEMSSDRYDKTIIEFRNQSAARLCIAFDEMNKNDKADILIRNMTKRTVEVNGSVYRKWIEAGGENEVLFGNLLAFPNYVSIADINEKASELKDKWNHYAALTATVERNRLFARTKEILMSKFQEQMREVPEDEEHTLGNRETVIKAFAEQLTYVREDELTDIWTTCLKLICRSRFSRTEAERILLGIERIKKENPNIDIRECAAISVIEYVSFWMASQMRVEAV